MKTFVLISLITLALGCGTVQHIVPPNPLRSGKGEFRIGVGYSTSPISRFSIQMGGYVFASDKDAIGVTFAGILPSSISYVRYWPSASGSSQLQFHYNDLFGSTFNPTFQLKYGLSSTREKKSHSGAVGIGYYHTPLLHLLFGNYVNENRLVPSLSYQFKSGEAIFEAEMLYGMTDYFVHYYKEDYLKRPRLDSTILHMEPTPQTIPHSSVFEIKEITEEWFIPGWTIKIDSVQSIVIAPRDPYADCISCGIHTGYLNSVTASSEHSVYWVWLIRGNDIRWPSAVETRELNMNQILSHYRSGGDLILSEDMDLAERAAARVHSGLQDIFFSISKVTSRR